MDANHSHTPATRDALAISEVLEMILVNVDMVTLLTSAQRVSKHWHGLISTSRPLQEILFFAPVPEASPPATWDWDLDGREELKSKSNMGWIPGTENPAWYPEVGPMIPPGQEQYQNYRPFRSYTGPPQLWGTNIGMDEWVWGAGQMTVHAPVTGALDAPVGEVADDALNAAGPSTLANQAVEQGQANLTGQSQPTLAPSAAPAPSCRPVINPLLRQKFGPCFFDFGPTYGFLREQESFLTMPWTTRPHQTVPTQSEGEWHPRYRLVKPRNLDDGEEDRARANRDRFTRPGASWRRMLVSQPPPRAPPVSPENMTGALGYSWSRSDGFFELTPQVPEEICSGLIHLNEVNGDPMADQVLRMGPLYDLVQDTLKRPGDSRCAVWFRVTWGPPKAPFTTRVHEISRHNFVGKPCSKSSSSCSRCSHSSARFTASERRRFATIKTPVVVEFVQFNRDTWFNHRPGVEATEQFDAVFGASDAESAIPGEPQRVLRGMGVQRPTERTLNFPQAMVLPTI